MNKAKTLGILVGVLALLNIGLLIFLMMGRPHGNGPQGLRSKEKSDKFIQKKFGFDEDQMKSFSKSKVVHMNTSQILQTDLENLSRLFYTEDSANKDEIRDSLLNEIEQVSEKIYLNNANHFEDVRSICKPEQLLEMKTFIDNLISPKRGKGPHKKRMKNKH